MLGLKSSVVRMEIGTWCKIGAFCPPFQNMAKLANGAKEVLLVKSCHIVGDGFSYTHALKPHNVSR